MRLCDIGKTAVGATCPSWCPMRSLTRCVGKHGDLGEPLSRSTAR